MAGKIRLLRQVADRHTRLHEPLAAVGLDLSGHDLHQRRFAGAVATDKANAFARRHRKFGAIEQRSAAKCEADIGKLDEGWCHCKEPGCVAGFLKAPPVACNRSGVGKPAFAPQPKDAQNANSGYKER